MSRISPVDPSTTAGKTKDMLDAVKAKLGVTPNMMKTMAQSPAVLEGYLGLSGALSHGVLEPKTRERIALALAQANSCEYCLSAHTLLGKKAGLSDAEITASRTATGADSKADAAVRLAAALNSTHGRVSQAQFDEARRAGLSDAEIAEVIAHAGLNVLTNWFNNTVQTEVDFPKIAL